MRSVRTYIIIKESRYNNNNFSIIYFFYLLIIYCYYKYDDLWTSRDLSHKLNFMLVYGINFNIGLMQYGLTYND